MSSREIHVVRVPRWVTIVLLVVVSAAMAGLIWFLSGKTVYREAASPLRLFDELVRYDRTGAGRANLLASAAPSIANALLFVPWGALAFLAFDRASRSRVMTYALVLVVGVTFALGFSAWQEWLPTRITGWLDVVWNAVGTFAGAVLGHLRKRVRIQFGRGKAN
jgi:glycopeptide antibiotics resistance protein